MLSNGTRIEDPRDLLPAVLPDSATARYAEEFEAKRNRASPILTTSLIGFLATGALMVATAVVGVANFENHNSDPGAFPALIATTLGAGTVTVGIALWGMILGGGASRDRESAFLAYPQDLERKLGFREAPHFAPSPGPVTPTPAPAATAPSPAVDEPTAEPLF